MTADDPKKNIDQLRPSSYDGIREYDNDLPRWWVWLFYATGVYAVIYIVGNSWFGVTIPPVPYEPAGSVVVAAVTQPPAGEDDAKVLRAMLTDSAALAKGKSVYDGRCAPCHGAQGGGVIGPNLTDDLWIHGGTLQEIKYVIENGVLEKGMLAWKAMLSQEEIRAVTVYIRSIKGSNPSGAKAGEGQPYTGDE